MTDHLEPFRRMVRSIRFVPPTWRTQPSQYVVEQQPNSLQLGSWTDTNRTADVVADTGPAPDPSEHVASLVRDAVSKRTVLPVTYAIAENIGDRISRLAIPKPVIPEYIPPQPVYSDNNYTPALVPQHHESNGAPQAETSPTEESVSIDAVAPEILKPESKGAPQAETSPTEEPIKIEAIAPEILKPEPEGAPQAETSPTEEPVSIDAVAPELFKLEEAIEELSETNTVEAEPSQTEETQLEVTDTSIPTPEETKPANLLEEVVAAVKPVVDSVVAAVEPMVEAVLSPLQPSEDPQVQPSESPEVSCPKCQSTQVRKKGHYKDKQRYVCKDCGKQFMLPESILNQEQQITASSDNTAQVAPSSQKQAQKTKSSSSQSKTKKKAKGFGSDKGK